MKILVINAGSSSLKYQLIDMDDESVIAKGICERIGNEGSCISGKIHGKSEKFEKTVVMKNHTEAFNEVKKALTEGEYKVINDLSEIAAVGHRIVQGGALFNHSVLVDDDVIKGIESLCDLAPLHNAAHIQGIKASIELFGKDVPQVVVFDNAFHSTMPPEAYMFGLPYEYYEKYALRKYGFHGTSHRFVSARCADVMGEDIKKAVDCAVVSVMSGNYVQRAETAVMSKYARAKAALLGGVDLVLELSMPYAIASAERFAYSLSYIIMPHSMQQHYYYNVYYTKIKQKCRNCCKIIQF